MPVGSQGGNADPSDSWLMQYSRKYFKFPTSLRKTFEAGVLCKISGGL